MIKIVVIAVREYDDTGAYDDKPIVGHLPQEFKKSAL